MEYIYDVVVEKNGGRWEARVPQLGGLSACADTGEAAVNSVTALLKAELSDRMATGREIPRYDRVVEHVTLAVDVAPEKVDVSKYVTLKEAARRIGVSKSRVSQMVASGRLSSVLFKGSRLIALSSVEEYLSAPRTPGRPRKAGPARPAASSEGPSAGEEG